MKKAQNRFLTPLNLLLLLMLFSACTASKNGSAARLEPFAFGVCAWMGGASGGGQVAVHREVALARVVIEA